MDTDATLQEYEIQLEQVKWIKFSYLNLKLIYF